jgi:hypothetical protein
VIPEQLLHTHVRTTKFNLYVCIKRGLYNKSFNTDVMGVMLDSNPYFVVLFTYYDAGERGDAGVGVYFVCATVEPVSSVYFTCQSKYTLQMSRAKTTCYVRFFHSLWYKVCQLIQTAPGLKDKCSAVRISLLIH